MYRRLAPTAAVFLAVLILTALIGAQSAPKPPADFTFVVLGDSRPSMPNGAQPGKFKDLIKKVDALNPAFVVHTGDIIYGSPSLTKIKAQYEDFKDAVKPLRAKLYVAIGNHEIQGQNANQAFFEKEFGPLYRSFDYEDSHFIILDSQIIGEEGRITGKQLEWLKDDLQKARAARHKFVFIHMPLYPVDGHAGQCIDSHPDERDALHKLFMLNRVDTVFVGHEHLFDEQTRNGVRYIITGGGGAPVWPSYKGTGDFYHFIVVSIKGDKVEMKGFRPAQRGRPDEEFAIGKTRT